MRLAFVISRSPSLCGECQTCKSAGDVFKRIQEYEANLEEGEHPLPLAAINWLKNGYPMCPPRAVPPMSTNMDPQAVAARPRW